MTDSKEREDLEEKHRDDRAARIESIKRWVAYLDSEPPEKWGPQLNAIVDGQLEAAQIVHTSAAQKKAITDVANEIITETGNANEEPN